MSALPRDLRRQLDRTVRKARGRPEEGEIVILPGSRPNSWGKEK